MRTIIVLCGLGVVLLSGCGGDAAPKPTQEAKQPVQITHEAQNANLKFALNLLNQLDDPDTSENLCFSPLSLTIALGMTLNGAEGETFDAIIQTLGYEQARLDVFNQEARPLMRLLKPADAQVTIHSANGLWIQHGFEMKPDFLRALLTHYESRVETVDFMKPEDAARRINRWVAEQTKQMIDKLFEAGDFNAQTRLALVNTLYFEGKWQTPFLKEATEDAPFYLEDGEAKRVPMMHLSKRLPYFKGEGFQAVGLPYGEGDYQFYLFLPEKGRKVAQLREQFTPENWAKWMAEFRAIEGDLQMPRFKIEGLHDLKPPLSALGMGIAFDPNRADFSRIADVSPNRLFIQKAIQKAVIEVDEEGTQAAAATGITVGVTAAPMPSERFNLVADCPFLFAIVHQPTGTILFMGIVREP
ncbi:MAG: serine protease inhibitor [Fimbriimonadales bacterium]|nr:MAG: serine protease inhibitor [Fimbriimonadales bacterium]